jgi:hypothetical protein
MHHQLQGKGVPVADRQCECVKLSVDGEKGGKSRKKDSDVSQNMTQEVCPCYESQTLSCKSLRTALCECFLGALGATTACSQGFHSTTGIGGEVPQEVMYSYKKRDTNAERTIHTCSFTYRYISEHA